MKKVLKWTVAVFLVIFFCFLGYLHCNYTVPILMYHSLDKERVGTFAAVSEETFRRQMKFIRKHGYNVILLDEYCRLLENKEAIPRNSLVITFDDGYKDNLAGIKVLRDFDFPATIFLVVDKIGKDGYLSKQDIAGFLVDSKVRIGSHTLTHAYLPSQEREELKRQIYGSKIKLETLFSRPIKTISYPIGGFNYRVLQTVESGGYSCGCTTNRGFSSSLNRFALRRIKVTNRDSGIHLWVKLSGFYNVFKRPKKPY